MRRLATLLLLAATVYFIGTLRAADRPKVGDRAPEFSLPSLSGKTVGLSDVSGDGPVVLVVLRGYPGYQCPACNRQAHDLLGKAAAFAKAGAQVVMVYPGPDEDLVKRAQEFSADKQYPANFHLLLDPGYTFTNLYGLRWDAPNETAYPATYLIGDDGVIFFADVSSSHGGRTSAADILAALK